jgi:hypothetical protein
MAFEISEIAIRMQVTEPSPPGQRMAKSGCADESEAAADGKERAGIDPRLVEECVRQVLQALRRQKER